MRKVLALTFGVLLGLGAMACGGDDDDSAGAGDSEESAEGASADEAQAASADEAESAASGADAPEEESGSSGGGGDLEKYCEITGNLTNALPDDLGQTPEELAATFSDLFDEHGDDLDELIEVAPDAVRSDLELGIDAFKQAAEGDVSGLESPEVQDASGRVGTFDDENCDF